MTEPTLYSEPTEPASDPNGASYARRASLPPTDDTAAAGLELKSRSQWSYARNRFFRHRLALVAPALEHERLGKRGPVEEGEGGVAVELGKRHVKREP